MNKFPKTITVTACEKFIKEALSIEKKSDQLELPVDTRFSGFSGYASAIQALITWVRTVESPKLTISSSRKSNKDLIDEIVNNPHKFTVAMFAKSILGNSGSEIRSLVNKKAKNVVESQFENSYGRPRGGLCWFGFVDHSSKVFNPNFYITSPDEEPRVKMQRNIRAVIKSMLLRSQMSVGNTSIFEDEYLDDIGQLFYELFTNSDSHGLKDKNGFRLQSSVRVIYTNVINTSSPAFIENIISNQPVLKNYLKATNQKRYAEVSFIDSGLGYVTRWNSDRGIKEYEGDLNEEYKVLKKCFKYRSSSTAEPSKGNGLPSVLECLTNLDGFIRIRSGKLSVYRDCKNSPFVQENDDYDFYDWETGNSCSEIVSEYSKVQGALVSVLIPLNTRLGGVVE